MNANALDTFKSTEAGFLGVFENAKPLFYYGASAPVGKTLSDVSGADGLPQVDISYGYGGLNAHLAMAAVEIGARGLVLAGMGAGGWTEEGTAVVEGLAADNYTKIVVSRRTLDGFVEAKKGVQGIYGAGFLNPQKARILLQRALYSGYEEEDMRRLFGYDEN